MTYGAIQRYLPAPLRRYILHFEAAIDEAVEAFAGSLAARSLVLDAGAGETQYKNRFARHRYVGVDLGVGDAGWNYRGIDALADLHSLPFAERSFDGCINIVTLEHVRDPATVVAELWRVLKPGGKLLLIAPHEWEEHQQPHDYYRYTRYGLEHLLVKAGFQTFSIIPVGGYFRLLSRRLLNGLQFFPGPLFVVAALLLAPPALVLPALDRFDHKRNFTLGFICTAQKL